MGREIRRVPLGWEHPKNERGHYQPLHDNDYETALKEWTERAAEWRLKYGSEYDAPPKPKYYRPAWTSEEATCYQLYERVHRSRRFLRPPTNSGSGW